MSKLYEKVVVVTGGSGLIGKAILDNLKSNGAITINAELKDARSGEATHEYVKCDVTSQESVKDAIDRVISKYGRVDGWVNNAYPRTSDWGNKFEDILFESWRTNVDFQLNSVFICSQEVLKIMKAQSSGAIVNISSIYGVVGPDFSVYNGTQMTMPAAYSAIKGGVINFSRYLAAYYGPYGITLICVSPGGIFDHQNQNFVSQYEAKVPMRRMGLPEDIAPAVGFLLSNDANYITGQNIIVDGGWTAI